MGHPIHDLQKLIFLYDLVYPLHIEYSLEYVGIVADCNSFCNRRVDKVQYLAGFELAVYHGKSIPIIYGINIVLTSAHSLEEVIKLRVFYIKYVFVKTVDKLCLFLHP